MLHALDHNYLDKNYLSEQLDSYEKAAQDAVEGNLMLTDVNANDTLQKQFPSKGDKWTIMQAIFFASTVCTTIGEIENSFWFNLMY